MECARLTRYGLLSVTGEDARAFLHAQLTKDIENLPPDRATLAGWCSAKGRLLASLLVIPAAQGFLLQLARDLAPGVASKLSMFVLRAKVRIQVKRRMVGANAPAGIELRPGQEFKGGTVIDVAPAENGSELLAVMPI